jgi:hypothetical protein
VEVDKFVMRVCLLALEDATGVKASFLVQTPAIIELSIGYNYLKGRKLKLMRFFESRDRQKEGSSKESGRFMNFSLQAHCARGLNRPVVLCGHPGQTDQSTRVSGCCRSPFLDFPSGQVRVLTICHLPSACKKANVCSRVQEPPATSHFFKGSSSPAFGDRKDRPQTLFTSSQKHQNNNQQ